MPAGSIEPADDDAHQVGACPDGRRDAGPPRAARPGLPPDADQAEQEGGRDHRQEAQPDEAVARRRSGVLPGRQVGDHVGDAAGQEQAGQGAQGRHPSGGRLGQQREHEHARQQQQAGDQRQPDAQVHQQVAQEGRDQRQQVARQPQHRAQVVAVGPQSADGVVLAARQRLARHQRRHRPRDAAGGIGEHALDAGEVGARLLLQRGQPAGDVAAARNAGQVAELVEPVQARQALQDAEAERGAADAASRQAQRGRTAARRKVVDGLVDQFQQVLVVTQPVGDHRRRPRPGPVFPQRPPRRRLGRARGEASECQVFLEQRARDVVRVGWLRAAPAACRHGASPFARGVWNPGERRAVPSSRGRPSLPCPRPRRSAPTTASSACSSAATSASAPRRPGRP